MGKRSRDESCCRSCTPLQVALDPISLYLSICSQPQFCVGLSPLPYCGDTMAASPMFSAFHVSLALLCVLRPSVLRPPPCVGSAATSESGPSLRHVAHFDRRNHLEATPANKLPLPVAPAIEDHAHPVLHEGESSHGVVAIRCLLNDLNALCMHTVAGQLVGESFYRDVRFQVSS